MPTVIAIISEGHQALARLAMREKFSAPRRHWHSHIRRPAESEARRGADGGSDMNRLKTDEQPGAAEAMAHDGVLAETLVLLVERSRD